MAAFLFRCKRLRFFDWIDPRNPAHDDHRCDDPDDSKRIRRRVSERGKARLRGIESWHQLQRLLRCAERGRIRRRACEDSYRRRHLDVQQPRTGDGQERAGQHDPAASKFNGRPCRRNEVRKPGPT